MKKKKFVKVEKDEILVVSLPVDSKERFERLAKEKGLDVSSLANLWLKEKLKQMG